MKLHRDISHGGTLPDNRVKMTMDEDSLAHLMSVLTDLYSDRELAVIREYATNAWDSHLEAGVTDPIEIETPAPLSPVYIVRDFGVGMSLDDVFNRFSKYGYSSKRDDENATGMLGLGCKSALTLTSQFTVVATQNGLRATVLVTRESDGAGALQVIENESTDECGLQITDEPNGVEIRIPVVNPASFNAKVKEFFRFWPVGSVLVDGEIPESFMDDEALELDPDVILTRSHEIDCDYVVMGNVPYPVRSPFYHLVESRSNMHAIVRVPVGAVGFAPSREALQDSKRTREVLDDTRTFISERARRMIQQEIDACTTHYEALRVAARWRATFHLDYTWNGQEIPYTLSMLQTYRWLLGSDMPAERIHDLLPSEAAKALHIVGCKTKGLQSVAKDKIAKYVSDNGLQVRHVFAHRADSVTPWVGDVTVVQWETIRKIKLDASSKKASAQTGGFRVHQPNKYESWEASVPPNACWMPAADRLAYYDRRDLSNMVKRPVVIVAAGSQTKFQRDYPNVPTIYQAFTEMGQEWLESLTPMQKILKVHPLAKCLKVTPHLIPKVLDPTLAKVMREISTAKNIDSVPRETVANVYNSLYRVGTDDLVTVPKVTDDTDYYLRVVEPLLERYPALQSGLGGDVLVQYLNAVYLSTEFLSFAI